MGQLSSHESTIGVIGCVKCKVLKGEEEEQAFYASHLACESGMANDAAFVKIVKEERQRRDELNEAVRCIEEIAQGNVGDECLTSSALKRTHGEGVEVDLDLSPVRKRIRTLSESETDSSVSDLCINEPLIASSPKKVGLASQSRKWDEAKESESVARELAHRKLLDRFNDMKANFDRVLCERDELRGKVVEIKKLKGKNMEMEECIRSRDSEIGRLKARDVEISKRESELRARVQALEKENEEAKEIGSRLGRRVEELQRKDVDQGKVDAKMKEWMSVNKEQFIEFHIPLTNNELDGPVLHTSSLEETIYCYKLDPTKHNCLHATMKYRGHVETFSVRKKVRKPK